MRVEDDLQSVGMLGFRESFVPLNEVESSNEPKWVEIEKIKRERERGRVGLAWTSPSWNCGFLSQYKD